MAAVRGILEAADRLAGPHSKFEELHVYPRLKDFLGEGRVQRPLTEPDSVFRGSGALVNLAGKTSWEEADTGTAAANLDLILGAPPSLVTACPFILNVTTQVGRRQNSGVRMKAPATRFEDWVVWQKAHPFVPAAYRVTRTFPPSET